MPNTKIEIERIFDAEVELLWDIWTEPGYIAQWFGSDPFGIVQRVDIDLMVGGKFRIQFSDSDRSVHTARGEYLNIDKYKNLKMTWEWESEPNRVSELNVDFISMNDKTKIVLTHSNLIFETVHNYEFGWNGAFNKIDSKIIKLNTT
jgi:uncharacterized protein YndB with AHSA1/START domain